MDKEFLYSKDPLFFNRPRIITVKDEKRGDIKCIRTFVTDEYEQPNNSTKHLTPYEDNDCMKILLSFLIAAKQYLYFSKYG